MLQTRSKLLSGKGCCKASATCMTALHLLTKMTCTATSSRDRLLPTLSCPSVLGNRQQAAMCVQHASQLCHYQ